MTKFVVTSPLMYPKKKEILSNESIDWSSAGMYKIKDVNDVMHYFPIINTIIEACTVKKEEK